VPLGNGRLNNLVVSGSLYRKQAWKARLSFRRLKALYSALSRSSTAADLFLDPSPTFMLYSQFGLQSSSGDFRAGGGLPWPPP
jgi:hypothetical protein